MILDRPREAGPWGSRTWAASDKNGKKNFLFQRECVSVGHLGQVCRVGIVY